MSAVSTDKHSFATDDRVRRFRHRAKPVILGCMLLFTAGSLWFRAQPIDEEALRRATILGAGYAYMYESFGPPVREERDGRGGVVMYYEGIEVDGDHFAPGHYRIFVGPDGRVYQFQRD